MAAIRLGTCSACCRDATASSGACFSAPPARSAAACSSATACCRTAASRARPHLLVPRHSWFRPLTTNQRETDFELLWCTAARPPVEPINPARLCRIYLHGSPLASVMSGYQESSQWHDYMGGEQESRRGRSTSTASEAAPGAAIAEPTWRHRLQRGQRRRHAAQHHRPRAPRTPTAQAHLGALSHGIPTATTRPAAATPRKAAVKTLMVIASMNVVHITHTCTFITSPKVDRTYCYEFRLPRRCLVNTICTNS